MRSRHKVEGAVLTGEVVFEPDDIEIEGPVHSIEETEHEGEDVGRSPVKVGLELVKNNLEEEIDLHVFFVATEDKSISKH